ncbi:hypothetical protein [Gloeocapsa sp. PCC 73106]|uniref:hypothetical protein n=1 Tax=Gloeocapsa sp. PCC 73106 TaxID=102232 RepID=UPI0002ABCDE7|nr:hypothetical protein [Gloeocapsa sp. PCC 73106]ELR97247.1 hypothetical protein GLO73106DRAFT_00010530 [Gloeocapsa sp. PCC 73106]
MSEFNPEIEKTISSFKIFSSEPDQEQEFLVEVIDELVDSMVEPPTTVKNQSGPVNIYEYVSNPEEESPLSLLVLQDEYTKLLSQLDVSNQTLQNQQVMIETLSYQLREIQEQLSGLERECTEILDKYNQQTYKLLETEKQLQELHGRLLRQQRYTLEYKTALEECFKETAANVISANNSLIKQQPIEPTELPTPESQQSKIPKTHWPSPGIESESSINPQKIKKPIDLPNFRR